MLENQKKTGGRGSGKWEIMKKGYRENEYWEKEKYVKKKQKMEKKENSKSRNFGGEMGKRDIVKKRK